MTQHYLCLDPLFASRNEKGSLSLEVSIIIEVYHKVYVTNYCNHKKLVMVDVKLYFEFLALSHF